MFQFLKKWAKRIKDSNRGGFTSSETELRSGQRYEARSQILKRRRILWNKLPGVNAEEARSWREQGRR